MASAERWTIVVRVESAEPETAKCYEYPKEDLTACLYFRALFESPRFQEHEDSKSTFTFPEFVCKAFPVFLPLSTNEEASTAVMAESMSELQMDSSGPIPSVHMVALYFLADYFGVKHLRKATKRKIRSCLSYRKNMAAIYQQATQVGATTVIQKVLRAVEDFLMDTYTYEEDLATVVSSFPYDFWISQATGRTVDAKFLLHFSNVFVVTSQDFQKIRCQVPYFWSLAQYSELLQHEQGIMGYSATDPVSSLQHTCIPLIAKQNTTHSYVQTVLAAVKSAEFWAQLEAEMKRVQTEKDREDRERAEALNRQKVETPRKDKQKEEEKEYSGYYDDPYYPFMP